MQPLAAAGTEARLQDSTSASHGDIRDNASDNRYGSVDIALLPRLEPLGASVIVTYILLGSFARKHQGWVVSQSKVAARRMRSAATIRRHLVRLRKAGLIETTGTDRKGKWRGSLTYRLLTPAEADARMGPLTMPERRVRSTDVSAGVRSTDVSAGVRSTDVSDIDIRARQPKETATTTTTDAQLVVEPAPTVDGWSEIDVPPDNREPDEIAAADGGGGDADLIAAEQRQPHSPTADQRVRGKQRGQRASEHRHPSTREMLAHLGILASTHDDLLAPYRSLPDDLALRRSMWLIVGHRNGWERETGDPRDLGCDVPSLILKADIQTARNPPAAARHRLRGFTDQITTAYHDIVRLHEAWVRDGSPSAEQLRERETERKRREWQRQLDADNARAAERKAQQVAEEASQREQAEAGHQRAVERQAQERRQAEREAQLVAALDALDDQQRGDLEQQRRLMIESKYPRTMHDDPSAQRLIDNQRKHQVAKALAVSGLTCPHRRALVIDLVKVTTSQQAVA
ncbi:MAG: hypothetical protein FJ167_01840 [Gammaproteobacteria bacterium]|nr:hypothetical protein [Gammaproteobacteria bacterium]